MEIKDKVLSIIADCLEIDVSYLSLDSGMDDIEEWDSLSHIQLIVAIEKTFKIKFTSLEIMKWKNVGEMVTTMEEKIK